MDEKSLRIIVGLGNPGKEYALTRHNLGFMVVCKCAEKMGITFKKQPRFQAEIAQFHFKGRSIHLFLPTTYMNFSGCAVRAFCDYHGYEPSQVAVVCDDTDLPFQTMRLRKWGSSGGHNGLKSIEQQLGTQHWVRLRLGIGRNLGQKTLADYVLERFSSSELDQLDRFIEDSVEVVMRFVAGEWDNAIALINAFKLQQTSLPKNNLQQK